jgi:hypothetical protein
VYCEHCDNAIENIENIEHCNGHVVCLNCLKEAIAEEQYKAAEDKIHFDKYFFKG